MRCPSCKTDYPAHQRFCFSCPSPNGGAMPLVEDIVTVNPAHLKAYQDLLEEFLADDFLEESEKMVLQQMRQQYGIPESVHQELLSKYDFRDTFPIEMAFNRGAVAGYGVQQQCLVMLRILNREPMPFRKVHFKYRLNKGPILEHTERNVMNTGVHETALPFMPEIAGQYILSMEVSVEPFMGEPSAYVAQAFSFQVHSRVQAQSVHIHQTGERIYGGGNDFTGPQQQQTALLGGGKWDPVVLRPKVSESDAPKQSTIIPALQAMPGLDRFELEAIIGRGATKKISVCSGNSVVFGKDKSRSNLRVAIEPFKEVEPGYTMQMVQENKRLTIGMISSVHFEIYQQNGQAMLRDKQSRNGTYLNGQKLSPMMPVPLENGSVIGVATVLDLHVSLLPDGAGVLLRQPNHYAHREHLILWGAAGLGDFQFSTVEPINNSGHELALEVIQGKCCIVNYGRGKKTLCGVEVSNRMGCPIQSGMDFEIGKAIVVVNRI